MSASLNMPKDVWTAITVVLVLAILMLFYAVRRTLAESK